MLIRVVYLESLKHFFLCKNLHNIFNNFLGTLYIFTTKEFNFNVTTYLFIFVP